VLAAAAALMALSAARAQEADRSDVSFHMRGSRAAFSIEAFARDPNAYIASRYRRGSIVRRLRADLVAAGFDCRDARANEPGLAVACERIEQTSRHCFSFRRVRIRTGGRAEVKRDPRCMGVIPAPSR
jgi:hypothetical protein